MKDERHLIIAAIVVLLVMVILVFLAAHTVSPVAPLYRQIGRSGRGLPLPLDHAVAIGSPAVICG